MADNSPKLIKCTVPPKDGDYLVFDASLDAFTPRSPSEGDTYAPAVGADWDGPPATTAAALDELAARLRAIEP